MPRPVTVTTVSGLRKAVAAWRADGDRVALIPTMGALHAGHLALVEEGRRRCRRSVVSIFVNPAQFAAGEDFDDYPRDLAQDLDKLAQIGADLLYAPALSEMYPSGFATKINVHGPSQGLCAERRPSHFTGVATVVAKLLAQCRPDIALFGEKDYQQLLVIRRLVRDLDLEVKIIGVPTLREADGLALSSRNGALTPKGRALAGKINGVLKHVAHGIASGEDVAEALARGRRALIEMGFEAVDYFELRDGETLAPLHEREPSARLFVAVHVDGVRLIDNIPLACGDYMY